MVTFVHGLISPIVKKHFFYHFDFQLHDLHYFFKKHISCAKISFFKSTRRPFPANSGCFTGQYWTMSSNINQNLMDLTPLENQAMFLPYQVNFLLASYAPHMLHTNNLATAIYYQATK